MSESLNVHAGMVIWKYQIPIREQFVYVEMPEGSIILPSTLQLQEGVPTFWALVDPKKPKVQRTFFIMGTGREFPEGGTFDYVGTIQMVRKYDDGHGRWDEITYVWHLFERVPR